MNIIQIKEEVFLSGAAMPLSRHLQPGKWHAEQRLQGTLKRKGTLNWKAYLFRWLCGKQTKILWKGVINMFCWTCGSEMNENAVVCVKCGIPKDDGASYCPHCGKGTNDDAAVCFSCGCSLANTGDGTKSKLAAGLLGIFFGSLGIHNFYSGYTKKAIIQCFSWRFSRR